MLFVVKKTNTQSSQRELTIPPNFSVNKVTSYFDRLSMTGVIGNDKKEETHPGLRPPPDRSGQALSRGEYE